LNHIRELEEIGMIVNASKTEEMVLGSEETLTMQIGQNEVNTKKEIKALGVVIHSKLSWLPHVKYIK